jgi:DNA-binding protein HU-beta
MNQIPPFRKNSTIKRGCQLRVKPNDPQRICCISGRSLEYQREHQLKNNMAKALTKSQVITSIAEKAGLTKKQAGEIIEIIVDLAYKNAKNTFTLPGLGKLVLVNRKARIGRNPATGEQIQIAAKRVVKFRVAKAAKDAILGAKK